MTAAILYDALTLAVPCGAFAAMATWLLLHYAPIWAYRKMRRQVLAEEVWPRGYLRSIPEDAALRRRGERLRAAANVTARVEAA